ncbi:MAG: nitroreductase family protein [Deltaproteobacteria bacterium]|nr:nitroreductase family protein [Deltaproteobacteria bacterium]
MDSTFGFDARIEDVIRRRCSWRTYDGRPLDDDKRAALAAFMAALGPAPFGSKTRFALVDAPPGTEEVKGTYGVVTGAHTFIVGAVQDGSRALEDFGHQMELIVLKATDLKLATCWLGGTLRRDAFGSSIGVHGGEIVPAVSPVGVSATRRALVDSALRLMAASRTRKPWEELFFDGRFGAPLSTEVAGDLATPLEMLRLAPSASNKQPWRVVVENGDAHLFLERTKGYAAMVAVDLQRLDMGIAMCHFALAARSVGLDGAWQTHHVSLHMPARTEYCATWTRRK